VSFYVYLCAFVLLQRKVAGVDDSTKEIQQSQFCQTFQKIIPLLKAPYAHFYDSHAASSALLEELKTGNAKFVSLQLITLSSDSSDSLIPQLEFVLEAKTVSQNAALPTLLQLPIHHPGRLKMFFTELLEVFSPSSSSFSGYCYWRSLLVTRAFEEHPQRS